MVLMSGLILTAFIALADNTPPRKTTNISAEKTIREYFKFPQVLLPFVESNSTESKVEVFFTTNEVGKVNFVLAKTLNSKLKEEIERQFMDLVLPQMKGNVTHSVTLNFRRL